MGTSTVASQAIGKETPEASNVQEVEDPVEVDQEVLEEEATTMEVIQNDLVLLVMTMTTGAGAGIEVVLDGVTGGEIMHSIRGVEGLQASRLLILRPIPG